MFIKATTHKRIVAAKNAEIAGLMKRLERADLDVAQGDHWLQSTAWELRDAQKTIVALRARLAPFTKIRNRDSRGRFIKDTVA